MSCIDLIFCTKLNVISKHSVDVSNFDIIYGKINIIVPHRTIYVREVWNYRKANVENIKNKYLTLTGIKLLKLATYEKGALLNQALINIFRNYISKRKKLSVTIDSFYGWLMRQKMS